LPELVRLMDWSRTNVWSTLHICRGAQAARYHYFGVKKYPLPAKMFGLFHHRVLSPGAPLLRGFDEEVLAPHSRHTEVRQRDIERVMALKLLSVSDEAGMYMASSDDGRMVFVTGHPSTTGSPSRRNMTGTSPGAYPSTCPVTTSPTTTQAGNRW
jgi:homoserine O-succinyltransferase